MSFLDDHQLVFKALPNRLRRLVQFSSTGFQGGVLESEAVVGGSRHDVKMNMRHILPGGFPIALQDVGASAMQPALPHAPLQPRHQHMAFVDGEQVHESDQVVVFVHFAGGHFALDDFTKDAGHGWAFQIRGFS